MVLESELHNFKSFRSFLEKNNNKGYTTGYSF